MQAKGTKSGSIYSKYEQLKPEESGHELQSVPKEEKEKKGKIEKAKATKKIEKIKKTKRAKKKEQKN